MTTETEIAELTGCRAPFLIGIRHHSPAMSVATPRLLEGFAPDVLAVDLPAVASGWARRFCPPAASAGSLMASTSGANPPYRRGVDLHTARESWPPPHCNGDRPPGRSATTVS